MDKITHQVRAEHSTMIPNKCMNSGMLKTVGAGQTGFPKSNSTTGSISCAEKLIKHLRIRPYLRLRRKNNCLPFSSPYLAPRSNFLLYHQTQHLFSIRIL